ncbi:MAG: selenide, water dikinase SelD [Limimaricola sp.]|uniref:selenide, water dikinase SelD n=1 Tax=Limimaricola sp. TaxID=2211665 RepID=UPI001E0B5612|nr:selenide, water dikinase SelD [Limimaricola sp.]MBI1418847.1 selenide, water dikinase SelD [Limimaricola sp.]
MQSQLPLTRDLVLIGGGHTHALVLRMWGMNPLPGARLTVINPGPTAPYSGMLPGFVAGHYGRDDLDIDLVKLARFAGARVVLGAVSALDPVARTITVPGRPPIDYDVASIDIGITSDMPALPGFAAHGTPAKPLGPFAARWEDYRETATDPQVAVIGGGVAGAELAMAMAHALRTRGKPAQVSLIDRGIVLEEFNLTARRMLLQSLAEQGVEVVENAGVAEVTANAVVLDDGRRLQATFVTGAAGAVPQGWLAETGLVLHEGFVAVDETLRSSDPAVFAAGDCAHLAHAPRPKAGVFAVREAPVLFDNLRAALSGDAMRPYRPQRDYLKLISLGEQRALAEKLGTARQGRLLWRWKDRIDRTFMAKFHDFPVMGLPDVPLTVAQGVREALGDAPLCGGCGAKVGRGALREVLADLPMASRDDVQAVAGDDAAVLLTGGARQVISTDHLRAFTADPVVLARVAAVHALGDVWAMGAKPQAATASVILPRLSPELQRRTLAEIMQAATEVMEAAGAAIVGGHSSTGDEATVGFTVTGLCDGAPITLQGARPGDALILTKPLGSGVIMAAEMRGVAPGADVATALGLMQQGQGAAAQLLAGAHAMTDVTGFGLAGHLAGLCEASGVAADLDLHAVPLMPGALALAEAGVRSTLFAENRAGAGAVLGAAGARGDLLFDPQTAGGLLAAVQSEDAEALVANLVAAGYDAAIIGRIVAGDPVITVRA